MSDVQSSNDNIDKSQSKSREQDVNELNIITSTKNQRYKVYPNSGNDRHIAKFNKKLNALNRIIDRDN